MFNHLDTHLKTPFHPAHPRFCTATQTDPQKSSPTTLADIYGPRAAKGEKWESQSAVWDYKEEMS